MMASAMPVVIVETFTLHRAQGQSWTEVGSAIRKAALQDPACLSFQLMRDRKNESIAVLLSEWTSMQEFNRFVRESGLLWLERGVHPSLTSRWTLLEAEPSHSRPASGTQVEPQRQKKPKPAIGITLPREERKPSVTT